TIRANTATTGGGGIEATNATSMTITGGSITGNQVTGGGGGGLEMTDGSQQITITGAHITDNHVSGQGGGIDLANAGVVKFTGTFIDGNTSSGGAGLWDAFSTSTSIFGGEFANNFSPNAEGGGFRIYGGDSVDIHATKITGNLAPYAGGGYLGANNSITI